jgi:pimeloyl-ACP methyl ester carboxylesterase
MKRHRIHVETARGPVSGAIAGEGPPVLLLAGVGSRRQLWGDFAGVLAQRFTVLAMDSRGVGEMRAGDRFSLSGAAEDATAFLDAADIPRASLLGASNGGVVALTTAVRMPERVSRLVVVSAAARLTAHGERFLTMLRDLIVHLPPDRVGAALMTIAFAPRFHARFAGLVKVAAQEYGLAPEDVPGALAQVEHLLQGWDLRSELENLELPALVLAGEHDPVVSPLDTAEVAAAMPRSRFMRIADAAHSVLVEGGRRVLDAVVDFLAEGNPAGHDGKPPREPRQSAASREA